MKGLTTVKGNDTVCVDRLAKETDGLYWLSRNSIDEFAVQRGDLKKSRRGAPRFVLKLVKWDYEKVKSLVAQCVKRRLCKVVVLQLSDGDRVLRQLNAVKDADLYRLEAHKSLAFKALKNEWSSGRGTAEHLQMVVCLLDEHQLTDFVLNVLVPVGDESSGESEAEASVLPNDVADYNRRLLARVRAETVPLLIELLRRDTLCIDELRFSWCDILEAAARYCVGGTTTTLQSLFLMLVFRLNHKQNYTKRDFYEDLREGLKRGDAHVGSYLVQNTFRSDACFRFIKEFESSVVGRDGELFPA